jgi:hypothetical protein
MESDKKFKTYFIKGYSFSQKPLTLRKDQKIFEAISSVGLKDLSDISSMTIAEIVNLLFKSNILSQIIRIILDLDNPDPVKPFELSDDDILDLTNDTIQEIISDFFMLNPALMKLLKTFAGSLGGITKTLI